MDSKEDAYHKIIYPTRSTCPKCTIIDGRGLFYFVIITKMVMIITIIIIKGVNLYSAYVIEKMKKIWLRVEYEI